MKHEKTVCDVVQSGQCLAEPLVITRQPPEPRRPAERPFDHPAAWQQLKAGSINNPLGYRSIDSAGKTISKKHPGVNDGKPARTKAGRARDAIDELRRALPGYDDYSRLVRFRLIPGVW